MYPTRIDLVTNKDKLFNPLFYQLRKADTRFVINYGGAGSGKSVSQHQVELLNILTAKSDTLVIRKHGTDIYDSCYKLIENLARQYEIYDFFTWVFSNAKREITYKPTGRRIIFKGVDDPDKLKSIVGIGRVLVEEANQLELNDFLELNRRARGIKDIQIILLFNPIDERHWIKKHFFDTPEIRKKTTVFHTTYKDNKFLTDQDKAELEQLSIINPNQYRIYALGLWGKAEVKNPWCHNFDYDKHVSSRAVFDPKKPTYFCHDFNVSPMVTVLCHRWVDSEGEHIHFFKEIILDPGDAYKMAERIKRDFEPYPETLYNAYFTGDASGRKRDTVARDNIHNWHILQTELKISDRRLNVPRANPGIADNKSLVNLVLATHPDFIFHPSMSTTINELQFTEATPEGDIMKGNRENQNQRADGMDGVRYFINTYMMDYKEKLKRMRK